MSYESPIVVYDACVLYPFHVRNLLIQCAVEGLVRAHWSDVIQDEWIHSLCRDRPDVTLQHLTRTRELMNAVLPDALVRGIQPDLMNAVMPDIGDRHVVAAAIAAGAAFIVTWNLRHFPSASLEAFDLHAVDPIS